VRVALSLASLFLTTLELFFMALTLIAFLAPGEPYMRYVRYMETKFTRF